MAKIELFDTTLRDGEQAEGGTLNQRTASVQLRNNGILLPARSAYGNGPIDALFNAINGSLNMQVELQKFDIRAIGSGRDVQGEITTVISENGNRFIGRGVSTDILEASVKAYLSAVNKMLIYQRRVD